jgi:hypothetical protein
VPLDGSGVELSRRFYAEVVSPLLLHRWPGLPHAAARIGSGSDVLALDDEMSRDHDWGLRLTVLVPPELCYPVLDLLDDHLPQSYNDLPVAFAFSGSDEVRHRVEVDSPTAYATSRLGVDPRTSLATSDWLSFTGQAVLELTAGPVFVDTDGALTDIRRILGWYPHDLWCYVVACDWQRLDEELPLMSRAGDRGDDLGSRVIAARLVDVAIHLGFMVERRWPPYAKWRGTMFAQLPRASYASPHLAAVLNAATWQERQSHFAKALDKLASVQGDVGLPTVDSATAPFWDRPYLRVASGLVGPVIAQIVDNSVRALPRGLGSIEQRSSNVNLLVDAHHRRDHTPPSSP